MASIPEAIINVVTLDGAKLSLSSGDTLVITSPQLLTNEQQASIRGGVAKQLPEGAGVLVLSGGLSIAAAITKARSD